MAKLRVVPKDQKPEIEALEQQTENYRRKSSSKNTKKAYASDWANFSTWSKSFERTDLPSSPETVKLYITHLANLGRSTSTIARAMAAIRSYHVKRGERDPSMDPIVREVWQGIRRTTGIAQNRAKPLLVEDLKTTIDSIRPNLLGQRDAALLLLGWAGALRRSEIVAIDFEDIEFVSKGLILTVRESKTDQERIGAKLGIPYGKDPEKCPVLAVKNWTDLSKITNGPIFYKIGMAGKKIFTGESIKERCRLSPQMVNHIVRRRMTRAGLSASGYSGHSLRAGFITSASTAQVPEGIIQIHTRHKSVEMLRRYVRLGTLFSNNPLGALL